MGLTASFKIGNLINGLILIKKVNKSTRNFLEDDDGSIHFDKDENIQMETNTRFHQKRLLHRCKKNPTLNKSKKQKWS